MSTFDPDQYGPIFAELLQCDRLRPLDAGNPGDGNYEALEALSLQSAFAHERIVDEEMASCCIAGIWLLHDFLDRSHTISQEIPTTTGSYWHGIMHRRECDFSNSKYWFRKVGDHPIFEQLAELDRSGHWDPFAFVDACQAAVESSNADVDICRQLQQHEWEILFDYCYAAAVE